jgi:transcriptional antiterminator RfaH
MNVWYAVFCKPRCEALAEANLGNQGYRVYLPRLGTQTRRDGKWVDTVEPLFPRYLFMAPGNDRQSLAPVRSTLGVSNLVRFGGQPASIPGAVVESLRAQLDQDTGACPRRGLFTPGAPVEFRAGPFKGLEGVFNVEAGDDRVFVLLEFMGKINKVKVCRDWLVPAI